MRKSRDASHSYESRSSREADDEDSLVELEALLAKWLPRGIGKYRGKLPLKCFACNKIGHIAANFPNGDNEHKQEKFKKYKGKGKIDCLITIDGSITDEESDGDANEDIVFVAIKEEMSDHKALVSRMDNSDEWIIDSGCSHHMTGDQRKFLSLKEFDGGVVRFGNDSPYMVNGKGSIPLNGKRSVDDVYWVEGLKHNLLSVSQLNDRGYPLEFKNGMCKIYGNKGELIATEKKTKGNLFHLNPKVSNYLITKIDDSWIWHRIFCHINFDNIVKVSKSKTVRGLLQLDKLVNALCKECQLGKMTSSTFKRKSFSVEHLLDLVHTDLCGPIRTKSIQGDKYFMIFTDDWSRMMWVTFLKDKIEAFCKFKAFRALAKKESGKKIKCLRIDQGGEFTFEEFTRYCEENGIK
ncbi:hypothetical protein SUGI_0045450 [Cryptomeria japonica]|nr:hypothetical protein SUGI_0045450 [Cryptomeria japonica]